MSSDKNIRVVAAVAVAMGVGAAVVTTPEIAWAEPSASDSSASASESGSESTASGPAPGRTAPASSPTSTEASSESKPTPKKTPGVTARDADDTTADADISEISDVGEPDTEAGEPSTQVSEPDDEVSESAPTGDRPGRKEAEEIVPSTVERPSRSGDTAGADSTSQLSPTEAAESDPVPTTQAETGVPETELTAISRDVTTTAAVETVVAPPGRTGGTADAPAPAAATSAVPAVAAVTAAPMPIITDLLSWFGIQPSGDPTFGALAMLWAAWRRPTALEDIFTSTWTLVHSLLFNSTPVADAQPAPLILNPLQAGEPIVVEAFDADGDSLTHTVAGETTGVGSAGGTLVISDGVAVYTPPSTWDGSTPYEDSFTLTHSDEGPHIHGLSGLLNAVTFGLLGDSGHRSTSTLTVQVAAVAGTYPLRLVNNTGGKYADNEIYVTIIGNPDAHGVYEWVDKDGVVHKINHNDVDAPGHLVGPDGKNYANMSFTLADVEGGTVRMPTAQAGTRIHISYGAPMYIDVNPNGTHAAPLPNKPLDPNYKHAWQYVEVTYEYQKVPWGGDTDQVDLFGVSVALTITQTSGNFTKTVGIEEPSGDVLEDYLESADIPEPWKLLVVKDDNGTPVRIFSPVMAVQPTDGYTPPPELLTWFDPAVDQFWAKYTDEEFTFADPDNPTHPAWTVTGKVEGDGLFHYKVAIPGAPISEYTIEKPTSGEIYRGVGVFEGVDGSQTAFLANLNAAFNRGVASTPENWWKPETYYPEGGTYNVYAHYFHQVGIDGKAYGFTLDNVNAQQSEIVLAHLGFEPPTLMTLTLH